MLAEAGSPLVCVLQTVGCFDSDTFEFTLRLKE